MQADSRSASPAARLPQAAWRFSRRHWRFVVIAMLAALHVVALRGVEDGGAGVLLLAHLGLLLLWQPVLRGEREVPFAQALLIGAVAAGLVVWLNWWLLAVWTVMLASANRKTARARAVMSRFASRSVRPPTTIVPRGGRVIPPSGSTTTCWRLTSMRPTI